MCNTQKDYSTNGLFPLRYNCSIIMAFSNSENVFARSVLCDEAISNFKSFICLSGDCFGKNRLATTYHRFVKLF
jgi:hypothetical protein